MQTKWSILTQRLEEARDVVARLEAELTGLDATPFGRECGGCGQMLATEGDFARHFEVPDARYPNLGNCPPYEGWRR